MTPKIYLITSEGKRKIVECLILSNGAWYVKYASDYITPGYKDMIIKRFDEAMKSKGYTRVKSMKIPEEYRRVKSF